MVVLIALALGQDWEVGERPEWVLPQALPVVPPAGEVQTLLLDSQVQVSPSVEYMHAAFRLNTEQAVRDHAELRVPYDPAWQTLVLHRVAVHRQGRVDEVLDRTSWHAVSEPVAGLYTGVTELVAFVPGLRAGDLVEYEYSLVGDNPALGGAWDGGWWMGWEGGEGRRTLRLHSSLPLSLDGPEPDRRDPGGALVWDSEHVWAPVTWGDEPAWYEPPVVRASTLGSWSEVVEWALPRYRQPVDANVRALARSWQDLSARAQVREAVDFVQDEIRYVGLEVGLHTLMPHPPGQTLANRYGDCKDKSLLLVALLNELGHPAWPALADVDAGAALDRRLPGIGAFDHVVTVLELEGRTLVVDPTVAAQEGPLERLVPIDLVQVLPVREGQTELLRLSRPDGEPDVEVLQSIEVPRFGDATMQVRTTYRYEQAQSMRATLLSTDLGDYGRQLQDYYSQDYPGIRPAASVGWSFEGGELEVVERWTLPDWGVQPGLSLYARDVESFLPLPPMPSRETPVGLTHPMRVKQTVEVRVPDPLLARVPDAQDFSAPSFSLSVRHEAPDSRSRRAVWDYRSRTDHIAVPDLRRTHDELVRAEPALSLPLVQTPVAGLVAMALTLGVAGLSGGGGLLLGLVVLLLLLRRRRATSGLEGES